jgi:hypothetical protein
MSAQIKRTTPKKTNVGQPPHHIDDYKVYITCGYVHEGLLTPNVILPLCEVLCEINDETFGKK